jgi:DNA-binding GntR family transcriptional regulator
MQGVAGSVFGALAPRPALADDVYERLKSLIMGHAIAPGARIPIDTVARELGVSPTPVREALARLEADDLVTKAAMRGYCATALLSRRELEELYEMRLLIEPWAARRAAELATPEHTQQLVDELATCVDAPPGGDYEAYRALTAHDARFHDMVLRIAGNQMVRAVFERSHAHLHLFRLHYGSGSGTRALEEHRVVVRSIASGDPDAAEAAMRHHLVAARDRLLPVTP